VKCRNDNSHTASCRDKVDTSRTQVQYKLKMNALFMNDNSQGDNAVYPI